MSKGDPDPRSRLLIRHVKVKGQGLAGSPSPCAACRVEWGDSDSDSNKRWRQNEEEEALGLGRLSVLERKFVSEGQDRVRKVYSPQAVKSTPPGHPVWHGCGLWQTGPTYTTAGAGGEEEH